MLERANQGRQIKLSKFTLPSNRGGLLLKNEFAQIDYQRVWAKKSPILSFTGQQCF